MLKVPALLACVTRENGAPLPSVVGTSTTWLAPLTSMTEPGSNAIVALLAVSEMLPPASRLPLTSCWSFGCATNVPRVESDPLLPICRAGGRTLEVSGSTAARLADIAPPGALTAPSIDRPATADRLTAAPGSVLMAEPAPSASDPCAPSDTLVGWRA